MYQQREQETSLRGFLNMGSDGNFAYKTKKPYRPPYFIQNAMSFIAMVGGFILYLLAFGGPAWYVVPAEQSILPKTFGLWQFCVRGQCVVEMTNDYMVKKYLAEYEAIIPAYEEFLMPVKVMMCLGVVTILLTMACNLAFIAGLPTFFLEWIMQLVTGLLGGIGVGIFGGSFRDEINQAPFGWSFWVGVAAVIVLLVNGAFMAFVSIMVFRQRGNTFFRKK